MEIYIVRHGQTEWNQQQRLQGGIDIPLNDEGRYAAQRTGRMLKQVAFDRIYSSPLKRAYETACLIRGDQPVEVLKDIRLREISFGVDEGREYDEIERDPSSYFKYFFSKPELYRPAEGGESLQSLCERAAGFLKEEVEPLEASCQRILIVAHGAMNKALLMHIKGESQLSQFWAGGLQKNCSVVTATFDGSVYTKVHMLEPESL